MKYHAGAERSLKSLTVSMAPNPSHLEFVNPVVAGMARAAGTKVDGPGKVTFDPKRTLPILIHGDAAFPGQGVVAETLNLARLDGYSTGGTIHVIANNQIGFTATSREAYGTSYASGLARGFKIPIVHVNADDPDRLHRGGARRQRLSGDVLQGRHHRPDRLSPLRSQRRRRAELHAAAALRQGRRAPDGAAPVGRSARSPAARSPPTPPR